MRGGQQVSYRQMLHRQNAVHGIQGELPPPMQKIGQMRLPESALPAQKRDADRSPLYPPQQFQS